MAELGRRCVVVVISGFEPECSRRGRATSSQAKMGDVKVSTGVELNCVRDLAETLDSVCGAPKELRPAGCVEGAPADTHGFTRAVVPHALALIAGGGGRL